MKLKGTLVAIAIGVGFQVAAAPQIAPPENSYAYAPAVETKIHLFNPSPQPADKNKIERVGNMSSQPWTQIVGWHPGESAFPSAETQEPQLDVIWIGHEPWH